MTATTYETVTYEAKDRIATVTLNRPERLNAINWQMMRDIRAAYDEAEADPDVWLVVVTGNGRALCAGGDVMGMPGSTAAGDRERPAYLSEFSMWDAPQEASPPYLQMTKPVITAVNGICCGAGLDLVTCADVVIASDQATFFDPHVTIGIVSAREMVRVARVMPLNVAMRMALTGRYERMPAQRAYEVGFISEVVPHEQLMDRAYEIANMINKNAPLAVRGTRLAIRKGLSLPVYEAELLAESYRLRVAASEDSLEGPRAFSEGRDPEWKVR